MSCCEAEGVSKGVPWPIFPDSSSLAPICVANLKSALHAKAPGQVNRPFPRKAWEYASICLCSALWVAAC